MPGPQPAGAAPWTGERAANLDLGLPTLPHFHQPPFRAQATDGGPNGPHTALSWWSWCRGWGDRGLGLGWPRSSRRGVGRNGLPDPQQRGRYFFPPAGLLPRLPPEGFGLVPSWRNELTDLVSRLMLSAEDHR